MQAEKAESEEAIQEAATKIARTENELKRMNDMNKQIIMKLGLAQTELDKLKSQTTVPAAATPDSTEPEVVITTPTPGATGRTAPPAGTTDYIVEDGDSFWKIAQEQLGDGTRYKEILELNPGFSEDQALIIGKTIKIPAR